MSRKLPAQFLRYSIYSSFAFGTLEHVQVGGHKMMKEVPALLQLIWPGKGSTGRFILKILHDGGRGLVELGFYEKLAAHAEGPGARGEVGYFVNARCTLGRNTRVLRR